MALKVASEPDYKSVVEVDLRDGDVLSMEGLMQKHTVHCLGREPLQRSEFWPPRINITWRWIANHRWTCARRHLPRAELPGVPAKSMSSTPWTRQWSDLVKVRAACFGAFFCAGVAKLRQMPSRMEGWPELRHGRRGG